ncbi:MAG: hypothetical protein CMH49_06140 [Myxococcales bacterium]|nr:hypothetical protein [Myxococcales bacterium]
MTINNTIIQQEILSQYEISNISTIEPISIGLIHQSFGLSTVHGEKYILQGLHHLLSTDEILADYEAVTSHLHTHCYGGPRLIKTAKQERVAEAQGLRWRLSTFVPGVTYTQIEEPKQAYIGGQALAHFHTVMSSIEYQFKSKHLGHNTPAHLQNLIQATEQKEYSSEWSTIAGLGEQVITALSENLWPANLTQIVVHGDPKISNLRFNDTSAIMIDLDTCSRHTRLVDLGDAVRSWCQEQGLNQRPRFSFERWKALVKGYLTCSEPLSQVELECLPRAGYLITLELASRFARDYLEDHYFAYDAERYPNRKAHNHARLEAMCSLAQDINDHFGRMRDYIATLTHT